MSDQRKEIAVAMLMMDGKLLTVNFLMAVLRRQAIRDLGIVPLEEGEECTDERIKRETHEIQSLMVKMAVIGCKDVVQSRDLLGWDGIQAFSQEVVNEVNRS